VCVVCVSVCVRGLRFLPLIEVSSLCFRKKFDCPAQGRQSKLYGRYCFDPMKVRIHQLWMSYVHCVNEERRV